MPNNPCATDIAERGNGISSVSSTQRIDCHSSHASSANEGLMFALVDSSIASLADDATDFDIVIAIADDVTTTTTTTTTVQHSHVKVLNRIIDRGVKGRRCSQGDDD